MSWLIDQGDCLDILRSCPSASVDALVTDPPAGIGFMGREWDKDKGGAVQWIQWLCGIMSEARRVLKPGAHGLVWALPRTSHWTAMALELAGFEIRDVITHIFATGFPKSLDLGEGRGTALKPASEHWILVRAPCEGTTTANVERWGTGGLEIDACRIGESKRVPSSPKKAPPIDAYGYKPDDGSSPGYDPNVGRWPANVIYSHAEECGEACVDGCPVRALDEQAGERKSGSRAAGRYQQRDGSGVYGACEAREEAEIVGSAGGASRFFYCAKPSPGERDFGLEGFAVRTPAELTGSPEGAARLASPRTGAGRTSGRRNHHPTVKSIALMRYLVRLVTPRGGVVLDPFCGSGSTGCAAVLEGLHFLGIDQDPEYVAIARARIGAWEQKALKTA
jgi:hypothetical protein